MYNQPIHNQLSSNCCSFQAMASIGDNHLKDLLNYHKLTREDLSETVTEDLLVHIAGMMTDWKVIAPHFGLTQANIYIIEHNEKGSTELQNIKFLHKWKETAGYNATDYIYTDLFNV